MKIAVSGEHYQLHIINYVSSQSLYAQKYILMHGSDFQLLYKKRWKCLFLSIGKFKKKDKKFQKKLYLFIYHSIFLVKNLHIFNDIVICLELILFSIQVALSRPLYFVFTVYYKQNNVIKIY